MNILIAGGTGFVGSVVTTKLHEQGHHVYILTRSPNKYKDNHNTTYLHYNAKKLPTVQAVINLAGDSLFGYWTKSKKDAILKSRIDTTETLIQMMEKMEQKPNVFISGSAVGFYGTSEEVIFTEKTTKSGNDFLADVVTRWENVAKRANSLGIRTVYARFGVVLGQGGGALQMMGLPVKLFVGGKIGSGNQWMSWVHVEDVARLIIFCLHNDQINGPLNVTSPNPLRNKEFMRIVAKTMKRPYWLHAPGFLVRAATGEMSMLITKGQYVIPRKALDHNFEFSYDKLDHALEDVYNKK